MLCTILAFRNWLRFSLRLRIWPIFVSDLCKVQENGVIGHSVLYMSIRPDLLMLLNLAYPS